MAAVDPHRAARRDMVGWSCSAAEAGRWVSNAVHAFPASAVTGWWQRRDVAPWLLVDPQDVPVGYGKIWDDADEDDAFAVGPLLVSLAVTATGSAVRRYWWRRS